MTILERYNYLFNKSKCIKAIIVDTNKRVNTYIIRIDDNPYFKVGERTYMINFDSVFLSKGLPTYFYYMDNPISISKDEISDHLQPLSPEQASRKIPISSSELYTAVEETITAKLIRYAEDGDKRIINTIFLMGAINLLVLIGGGYFLFTQLENILIFITENEDLIQAIKDMLISGVGN